jgi:hypothetical protein
MLDMRYFAGCFLALFIILASCGDDDTEPTATPGRSPTETPSATARATALVSDRGSSQDDPVPSGETGIVSDTAFRVLNVNFDAEDEILAYNDQNEAAPGLNMVLAKVEVTNNAEDAVDLVADIFWNLVADEGIEYDGLIMRCGIIPDELRGQLNSGESATGNVCVQAGEDDADLVLAVEMFDADFNIATLYMALE